MSYDEEEQKRSRVVVETPTSRREVVQQQTIRRPEESRGFSTGAIVTVALTAIAITAILFLFLTNSGDDANDNTNVNIRASAQPTPFAQQPVIVSQPAPTPIIIQQAPATQQPAPVIIQQAPPATTAPAAAPPVSSAPPANDDSTLQTKLDKAFEDDTEIAASNIDVRIVNGRVMLSGSVSTEAIKQRAERLAYKIKGVLGVDNKIVVGP